MGTTGYFCGVSVMKYDKENCFTTYLENRSLKSSVHRAKFSKMLRKDLFQAPLSLWNFLGWWQHTANLHTVFCVSVPKFSLFIDMPYRIRKEHVSLKYGLNVCNGFISK